MQTHRSAKKIETTLGELAAAFYEVALEETGNQEAAVQIAQRMVQDAMRRRARLAAASC
jgi:hypothetical protein